jgi:CRISPR-associated protein Cas1
MLDYGYAILRSAVLRALACRGFIAALGLHHTSRAGTHALADDLMEPLRPFIDQALRDYITESKAPEMKGWMKAAANVLLQTVPMRGGQVRLINAIDFYVQGFATHVLKPAARPTFAIPLIGEKPCS